MMPRFLLTRRQVVAATVPAAASLVMPVTFPAAAAGLTPLAPAAALIDRTTAFLASLDDSQRSAARFPWGGDEWANWNYFGFRGYIKPGLRLEQMSGEQQQAAWALLAELLSPTGLEKARNVMLLQDVLAAMGDGADSRSSKRFSIAFFGEPAASGQWGLRLEGHHLSLSFAVSEGAVVSVTPAAFAARPNRIESGPHAGLTTLLLEESLARQLFADLSPKLQSRARLADRHLSNILSTAGRERSNAAKEGIAAAEMTSSQRDLLWRLVETYVAEPYVGALAETQRNRVRQGDTAAVHFAWYGPNDAGRSFGYRVIGDAFVIELGCVGGDAQHIHPVFHDLGNVLGQAA